MFYSQDLLNLIKKFEGLHLNAYECPAGIPTIGWGSTFHYDLNRPVKLGDTITDDQAEKFLKLELDVKISGSIQSIPAFPKLSQGQRDALVDFMYNLGANFYKSKGFETISYCLENFDETIRPTSTLFNIPDHIRQEAHLKKLSPSDRALGVDLVPYAFLLYRNPGTNYERGLLRRRIEEVKLWQKNPEKVVTRYLTITAIAQTCLKKSPHQSSELLPHEIHEVDVGKVYRVKNVLGAESNGNIQIELDYGAGTWWVYPPHWDKWASVTNPTLEQISSEFPSYESIDWNDFNQQMGPYFTLGEYYMQDSRRIASTDSTRRNSYKILSELDKIRREWGSPIRITSGYRPESINASVGGVRNSRHVSGDAVDIADARGNTLKLQRFLDKDWYGALGYGASYRGFVHLDCRNNKGWKTGGSKGPRWNY